MPPSWLDPALFAAYAQRLEVKRRLAGARRLTRFREYMWFVLVTTLLGAAAGGGSFGWPLVVVLIANWLAVGFAFMINDVEDAPDDALNPAKQTRNPVSSGDLTPRTARLLSYLAAALAALLYASLGWRAMLWGWLCLALAYLYSARHVRLKTIPVADLVSHAMMLAGLQFLAAFDVFGAPQSWLWTFALVFVMSISLYGQLFNELRDLEGDVAAGVTHTASLLGPRAAHALMISCFVVGGIGGVLTVAVAHLIPAWVVLVMASLAALLCVPPALKVRRTHTTIELQEPFQKPLEVAGALALATWFAGPSALAALHAADFANPSAWVSFLFQ